MEKLNKLLSWGLKMAKKVLDKIQADEENLPLVILLPSENKTVDLNQKSEEIKYYLSQILLIAQKRGRPSKEPKKESQNAA